MTTFPDALKMFSLHSMIPVAYDEALARRTFSIRFSGLCGGLWAYLDIVDESGSPSNSHTLLSAVSRSIRFSASFTKCAGIGADFRYKVPGQSSVGQS